MVYAIVHTGIYRTEDESNNWDHASKATGMPPANIAAVVMKLDTESCAIPDSPCPDVQPPACLEPMLMSRPPKIALLGEMTMLDVATSSGRSIVRR